MKRLDKFTGLPVKATPKEDFECKLLVSYLRRRQVLFFSHIAHENPSLRRRVKNAQMGVTRGVPDYIIILPNGKLCFIEMKRRKASKPVVSPAQGAWLERFNEIGVAAKACYGFDEAKDFIEELWPLSEQSSTQLELPFVQRMRPGAAFGARANKLEHLLAPESTNE